MDQETFEQIPLNHEKVEEAIKFLKENMFAIIKFYKGDAFSVEAPNFVELLITQSNQELKEIQLLMLLNQLQLKQEQ